MMQTAAEPGGTQPLELVQTADRGVDGTRGSRQDGSAQSRLGSCASRWRAQRDATGVA
jgi:hypothetical protein